MLSRQTFLHEDERELRPLRTTDDADGAALPEPLDPALQAFDLDLDEGFRESGRAERTSITAVVWGAESAFLTRSTTSFGGQGFEM